MSSRPTPRVSRYQVASSSNALARNGTGISASNNQLIAQQVFSGNAIGVNVVGAANTRIIGNTFYSAGEYSRDG